VLQRLTTASVLALATASLGLMQTFHFKLPEQCRLPFASIAPVEDPYESCDISGRFGGHPAPTKAKMLESAAKNNFCADASDIVPMHFEDFTRLEGATDPSQMDLAHNRADLKVIEDVIVHGREVGEGTVVQLVAFMRGAHISDCSRPKQGKTGGEAVNCNMLGTDKNDIHIILMPLDSDEETGECESVTAEMIPHFRPETWSSLDMKTPTENPVRVTGQLFYDNSHKACAGGKGSPPRRTVWEIHPVYQLDVCTNTNVDDCKQEDASVWVTYDTWVTQPGAHITPTGKKQRQACISAANNAPNE
jgi:hypothetical protein